MANYETVFMFNPDVTEEQYTELTKKFENIVTSHDGEMLRLDDWGKRKLAYKIGKHFKSRYACMYFTGNNKLITELERNARISDLVIRFLTIKNPDQFTLPLPMPKETGREGTYTQSSGREGGYGQERSGAY